MKKLFTSHADKSAKDMLTPDQSTKKGAKTTKNLSDTISTSTTSSQALETKINELQVIIQEKDAQILKLQKELEKLRSMVKGPIHAQNFRTGVSIESESVPGACAKDLQTSKKILESLGNNMYMRNLQKEHLTEIVKAMFLEPHRKDDVILREGESGDFMFLVEEGQLELSKGEELIGKLGPGQAFGEHAFLYGCNRTTNVTAITDCKLWVLSKATFEQIMLRTMLNRQKSYMDLLNKVPLFNEFPDYNLCKIIDILLEVRYSPRETIYTQGNKGETLYIIKQGTVDFFKKRASQGDGVFTRVLSEGAYFGEKSLLGEEYYVFDARAGQSGCTLLQIERDAFSTFIGNLSGLRSDFKPEDKKVSQYESQASYQDYNATYNSVSIGEKQQPNPLFKTDFMRKLTLDDLHTVTTLDVDSFSRTELVVPKSDPRISYALKQIKKKNIVNLNMQSNVIKEKRLLMEINSNFIVKLFKTFRDRKYVYLLMEACLGGTLSGLIRENGSLSENAARFYIACLVEGVNHLHQLNIIYRNLKPANILIDDKGYCKLANFIFSKKIQAGRKTYSFCGTPEYVAPEVILNKGHDAAVDYWGLGILIYEMLSGAPPFSGDDPIKTYNIIMKGFDNLGFPHNFSRNAQALIRKLCRINPNERIGYPKKSFGEVQKHKWFEAFVWQNLKNMVMEPPIVPTIKNLNESYEDEDEFPRDDEIPPDETSGWDKDF